MHKNTNPRTQIKHKDINYSWGVVTKTWRQRELGMEAEVMLRKPRWGVLFLILRAMERF